MTTKPHTPEEVLHAVQLTRQMLDDGINELPHDITERLRAARERALAQRVRATPKPMLAKNEGVLGWLQRMPAFTKGLVALPVLAVALFLGTNLHMPATVSPEIALNNMFDNSSVGLMQAKKKNSEMIDVDAILNEKIPLQAYLNDDFNQYVEQNIVKLTEEEVHSDASSPKQ